MATSSANVRGVARRAAPPQSRSRVCVTIINSLTDSNIITGGLQELVGGSGIWVRFQGASATDGDIWEIEVYGSHIKQTNKSNATIELSR